MFSPHYHFVGCFLQAGVNSLGTDECAFNAVLSLSSFDHLRLVFKEYQKLRDGASIEDDIKSEMSGTLQEGYLAIGTHLYGSVSTSNLHVTYLLFIERSLIESVLQLTPRSISTASK